MEGILTGIYPVINVFARPTSGCFSYNLGREVTLSIVTVGIAGSFLLLGQVTTAWTWTAAPNCLRRNELAHPLSGLAKKPLGGTIQTSNQNR
jgi:nitrate/nitrite transporter NarK